MARKKQTTSTYSKIIIVCALLFAWSGYAAWSRQITGGELHLFRAVNNLSDSYRWFFVVCTQLGSIWMLFAATLFVLYKHRNFLALRVFAVGASTYILVEIIKHIVRRYRPDLLLTGVHVRELPIGTFGFPSGHTAMATAVSLTLLGLLPWHRKWLAATWIGLVGFSRVYLGVHAPFDVVGGAALGLAVVCLERMLRKAEKPLEKYV